MKAVILAAGVGSRIRPLTDSRPKSLIEVGGKTLLGRMMDSILNAGIKDVVVVTGYNSEQIENLLLVSYPEISFSFIYNKLYIETNTAYSLLLAKQVVDGDDFVKFDADVVFESEIIMRLLKSENSALCIDRNIHLEEEEVKVVVDKLGRVLQVGKKIDPKVANGESIGIEKFNRQDARVLFMELEKLMEDRQNWKEYYDDSYTVLVANGVLMSAVDITGLRWVEVDTLKDLETAEKLFGR